ncbi:response regulator transcription factor [Sulfurimonas sp.]
MNIIFFSADTNLVDEWIQRYKIHSYQLAYDIESLFNCTHISTSIIIADYDTLATQINKLITSNTLPDNFIILERQPAIITGKMLISHAVKAYGNSRMLQLHYSQMIEAVKNKNIWTYPELTATLVKSAQKNKLSQEAQKLIEHRLTQKEKEVINLLLKGLTNEAIAQKLTITQRTVKAHISSIFAKLHVNDRLSLVLLLK